MKTLKIIVNDLSSGKRLDFAIFSQAEGLSKRKIKKIIDLGGVYVNKKRVHIASKPVRMGDEISVYYDQENPSLGIFEVTKEQMVFDDKDICAFNKPSGVSVQNSHSQDKNNYLHYVKDFLTKNNLLMSNDQIGLVHRLDKDTSGLMIFAKNNKVNSALTEQFKEKKISKWYLALSHGIAKENSWRIENKLSMKNVRNNIIVKVSSNAGKVAISDIKVLKRDQNKCVTLFEVMPQTGRTHQIRVHLSHAGFPIVGDRKYGRKKEDDSIRLMLHSVKMKFIHPGTGQEMTLEVPIPEEFKPYY